MVEFADKPKVPMKGGTAITPDGSTPTPETLADGQHRDHWVLPAEERAKGFIRPVRHAYRHTGPAGPKFPLRDLTNEEKARYAQFGYLKYEKYPENGSSVVGRFWTQRDMDAKRCGAVTTMPGAIAETYARDPKFYGSTFCCGCGGYFPVEQFVWDGSDERVGS
jgi:hypothetical protein